VRNIAPEPRTNAPVHRTATDAPDGPSAPVAPGGPGDKDSFLAQVKSAKAFFYNTVVAQAYRVDVTPARITFTFLPTQRVPKQQCDDSRAWLEGIAEQVMGRKVPVVVAVADGQASPEAGAGQARPVAVERQTIDEALRSEVMNDPTAQALFEIFPVEKSRIEEA
jgi:hypothetical protein